MDSCDSKAIYESSIAVHSALGIRAAIFGEAMREEFIELVTALAASGNQVTVAGRQARHAVRQLRWDLGYPEDSRLK